MDNVDPHKKKSKKRHCIHLYLVKMRDSDSLTHPVYLNPKITKNIVQLGEPELCHNQLNYIILDNITMHTFYYTGITKE